MASRGRRFVCRCAQKFQLRDAPARAGPRPRLLVQRPRRPGPGRFGVVRSLSARLSVGPRDSQLRTALHSAALHTRAAAPGWRQAPPALSGNHTRLQYVADPDRCQQSVRVSYRELRRQPLRQNGRRLGYNRRVHSVLDGDSNPRSLPAPTIVPSPRRPLRCRSQTSSDLRWQENCIPALLPARAIHNDPENRVAPLRRGPACSHLTAGLRNRRRRRSGLSLRVVPGREEIQAVFRAPESLQSPQEVERFGKRRRHARPTERAVR
jgi:hypothetical protein